MCNTDPTATQRCARWVFVFYTTQILTPDPCQSGTDPRLAFLLTHPRAIVLQVGYHHLAIIVHIKSSDSLKQSELKFDKTTMYDIVVLFLFQETDMSPKLFAVKVAGVVLALLVAPALLSVWTEIPVFNVFCWLGGIAALLTGCIMTFRSEVNAGKLYIFR